MTFFLRRCLCLVSLFFACATYAADSLPSWKEGPIKASIIQFVHDITDKQNPHYVAPEDRIATIDNDGTLWVEKPIYTQVLFAFSRVKTLAATHPAWKTQKPFSVVLSHDPKAIAALSAKDMEMILAATLTGMTVDDFHQLAAAWLATAKNPHFNHLYTELVYQPMLEVLDYLRSHDFKVYIVSGGGQDFMRAFATKVYGVPPEHIIGSAGKMKYTYEHHQPVLIKLPEMLLVDNYAGKAESIYLFIGKKPIITFGNSDGDQQMLEWTESNDKAHLMLLVHHDDAKREYAYDTKSSVGTFSDALRNEAIQKGWKIISMQHDWKTIFPFELKNA